MGGAHAWLPLTHLLLHLLNLLDGAPPLRPVLVPQQIHADVPCLVELLFLLLLGLLQLALSTDAFCMVHVVGLHHLRKRDFVSHLLQDQEMHQCTR